MSLLVDVFYSVEDLDQPFISSWKKLESNALVSNAYLSPNFVIPAIKNLDPKLDIVIFSISQTVNNEFNMLGLGVFNIVSPTLKYPFYYLKSYQSSHSFLGGILLDKTQYKIAAVALFDYIKKTNRWSAIQLSNYTFNSAFADINNDLFSKEIHWLEFKKIKRNVIYPEICCQDYLNKQLSRRSLKDIRRRKRNLHKFGNVFWNVIYNENITDHVINDFLRLEHSGWKGESGSSLKSRASSETFFINMIHNFIESGDVFFTEIRLDNKVIASTCNFISGNVGFAFKLGWDRDYAKYSIGYMNEIEFISNFPEKLKCLTYIDSGAEPDSFLNKLWGDKIKLVSGMYSLNKRTYLYLKLIFLIKYWLKK